MAHRVGDLVLIDYPTSIWDGRICQVVKDRGSKLLYGEYGPEYSVKDTKTGKVKNFLERYLINERDFDNHSLMEVTSVDEYDFGNTRLMPVSRLRTSSRGVYYTNRGKYRPYVKSDDIEGLRREADAATKDILSSDLSSRVRYFIWKEFPNLSPGTAAYALLVDSLVGDFNVP